MKLTHIHRWISAVGLCGVAAIEALHPSSKHVDAGGTPTLQNTFNGWVNPEDLTPMPQCIAQQDQSTWLRAMTACTKKRCTSHFGIICTHHQWLTQLSCLSAEFSSDIIQEYLPYCSRSVLIKAQLYYWVRNTAGRTWLIDVGDANQLQNLSPVSLVKGYAAIDTISSAPTCLTSSFSTPSREHFQHVMASCTFTSTTQLIGNPARPWEYSESLRSMIALGFETVGYNLTGSNIRHGEYFDKDCFCSTFTMDLTQEPCSDPGQIDLTRERLWINATCGPTSLPDNWTDALKTVGFAYIPVENWHWPTCVTDMPNQVTELIDQCATDACELDPSGYCRVKRAVDRTCFCHGITYNTCGGSCQIFETRIEYVKWLHDLCGNVKDWQGLPDNWRRLAAPSPLDMIPWRWTIKPSNNSTIATIFDLGSIKMTGNCVSTEWMLGSFALINMTTFIAAFFSQRKGIRRITRNSLGHPHSGRWFFMGILIATLQLLSNYVNGFLVQKTLGYEDVPVVQLMLLWCSMPRLGWVTIWPVATQLFGATHFPMATSSLFAEVILQFVSSCYMIRTVNYGRKHNFYLGSLENAERGQSAKMMYAGALLWLIVIIVAFVQFLRGLYKMSSPTVSGHSVVSPEWQRRKPTTSIVAEEMLAQLNDYWARLGENLVHYGLDESRALRDPTSTENERGNYTVYGTLSIDTKGNQVSQKAFAKLFVVTAISMPFLWVSQWLFWGGFIGLSSGEFCPPKLGLLTAVWIVFSLTSVTILQ